MSALQAERLTDAAAVVLPNGWRVTVHDNGAVVIQPAPGQRVTQPSYRALPIGAVLTAADAISAPVRIAGLVHELVMGVPPLTAADVVVGDRRHQTVARWYRRALAEGLPPRAVLAALYGLPEQKVGRWITEAREAGVLEPVHLERQRVAEEGR